MAGKIASVADPDDYRLVAGPPTVDAYLQLRADTGLTPRRRDQAEAALAGSWSAVQIIFDERTVGMGRVLGDGGWYFHIVDIAVLPDHQRRGLGARILNALLESIRAAAPPGAVVNLLADPPGRDLYRSFGFHETAPHSIGMARKLDDPA